MYLSDLSGYHITKFEKKPEPVKCDDDKLALIDSTGVEFDDDLHRGETFKTPTGKWQKKPRSKKDIQIDDSVKVTSDVILSLAREFGAAIGGQDKKVKTNKALDDMFKRIVDEKFGETDLVSGLESKVPYLLAIVIPIFYVWQGAKENKNLMEKIRIKTKMILIKPWLIYKDRKNQKINKKNEDLDND